MEGMVCLTILHVVTLSVVLTKIVAAEQSLVLLNVLFRHGDRNPRKTLGYNDPYQNESYWPGGFGALNNEGKRRMFQVGQRLKEKYGTFLGNYSDSKVRVRSTDMSRTLMSAECFLAGLFPPEGDQIWNQDLLWQPIPIHTVPLDEDVLLYDSAECPAYDEDLQNYINSDHVQRLMKQNITALEYFENMTGLATFAALGEAFDTIRIQLRHNYSPPAWVHELYPDWLYSFYEDWNKNGRTSTTRMKRILCGPIFEEWKIQLTQLQEGSLNELRAFFYSAHDTNINAVRSCFGYETPWAGLPDCGASLVMEVHYERLRGFYVKMLYHNGTEGDPRPLSPMGCGSECPLDDFIANLNSFIPESWHEECFGKPHNGLSHDVGYYLIMAMFLLSAATAAVLITFLVYKKRPSRRSKYQIL